MTHVFRSADQVNQLKDFKAFLSPIMITSRRNTAKIWLEFSNNLTLKELYILYNSISGKNLKVPDNTEPIFDIKLIRNNKVVKFKANFVSMKCHKKSFYG